MPQCRQKGYASRLLEEVRKIGAETGATKIHLNVHVNHDRADAHRLYFKNGFEICAYHSVVIRNNFLWKEGIQCLKILTAAVLTLSLAACASGSGQGSSQMYGEIKAGVETSHQR